jgi:hypothetical protein
MGSSTERKVTALFPWLNPGSFPSFLANVLMSVESTSDPNEAATSRSVCPLMAFLNFSQAPRYVDQQRDLSGLEFVRSVPSAIYGDGIDE